MGKKLTDLNQYVSIITNTDQKWFVMFEHTLNYLSFGYVRSPQLECYFSSFFFFFIIFLRLSTFETSKRTVFKVWAIEDVR